MSILGYSSAYFLPQYWANTPLYGEKIIPLLDYILSTDYQYTDKLASAFYDIESKYKNTADLPIDKIEAIIEESGYKYVRDLLGQDEESLRLLVYILVLINELKGSKRGIETVLNLLKTRDDSLELHIAGNPTINSLREVSDFSDVNFISYSNFSVGNNPFEFIFSIKTPDSFNTSQCIASSPDFGFYLGIDSDGKIELSVGEAGENSRTWQTFEGRPLNKSNKYLETNTEYNVKFTFNGTAYDVSVSKDGAIYSNYLSLESSKGLGISGGVLLVGINGSTSVFKSPFLGTIKLAPLSVSAKDIIVTEWYETFPVGIEDTYSIEADIDVNLMSTNFFVQFAKFAERYVYPSLRAFRARMALVSKITFLPWVRQKVVYVSSNISSAGYEKFEVIKDESTEEREDFNVVTPILYAWGSHGQLVYTETLDIDSETALYNRDYTDYGGSEFTIASSVSLGVVEYYVAFEGEEAERIENEDIYSSLTPFQTRIDTD